MKIKSVIVGIVLANMWLFLSCSGKSDHSEHVHDDGVESEEDLHGHEHENGDEIILEPKDAERLGVVTSKAELQPFNEVITVSGRIINSSEGEVKLAATTPGIVTLRSGIAEGQQVSAGQVIGSISSQKISGGDPNQAAKVAISSAKRELDRLEPLLKEGIVTQGEYNAALAAYQSAKAGYSPAAASGILSSPINGVISQLLVGSGEYVDAGATVAMVSRGSQLILTADVPERYRNKLSEITGSTFRPSYSDIWYSADSLGGKRIQTSARDISSKAGYIPVSFSIMNDGSLSAGSYAEINLICGNSAPAIVVPTEAITEQQGTFFMYVRENGHGYEKRKVEPGESDGRFTSILSGIMPGEEIVVKGAIMVKLAESNGAVPEGHSHNH